MARSTATIKAGIMVTIAADPLLGTLLTSTSLTSLFGLMAYVMAACQNLLEQSWDDYLVQINTYATQTPAASLNWIAAQAFLYQYDPSNLPNTNTLNILPNGALGYPTVDPQFNIVTRCAAITTGNNEVHIKVAQGAVTAPTQITGTALTQLQSYFDAKGTAGVNYTVISLPPDQIAIYGTVYYKAGFGGVVSDNVKAALNAYLNNIAIFDIGSKEPINYEGIVKVNEIIDAIQNAEGVDDFELDQLYGHADGIPLTNAYTIYNLQASPGLNNRSYTLAAGYAKQEDSPNTWTDTISYLSA
jgi:hypothetical protein